MTAINFSFIPQAPIREVLIRDSQGKEIGRATRIIFNDSTGELEVTAKMDSLAGGDLRPLFAALDMVPESMLSTLATAIQTAARLRAERAMTRAILGVDSHVPMSVVASALGDLMDRVHPAPDVEQLTPATPATAWEYWTSNGTCWRVSDESVEVWSPEDKGWVAETEFAPDEIRGSRESQQVPQHVGEAWGR